MIVFDLECSGGAHRFEGWFKSSEDFAHQQQRGLVACPHCGSADIAKAPMEWCSMFAPREGEWVVRQAKTLCTDATN